MHVARQFVLTFERISQEKLVKAHLAAISMPHFGQTPKDTFSVWVISMTWSKNEWPLMVGGRTFILNSGTDF